MGKAARQRRLKRMKYLAGLAREAPARFEMAWEKRLASWLEEIREDAARLKDRKGLEVPPAFGWVEEAMAVLKSCGEETYRRHARGTFELLTDECCRQFAGRVDLRLFRMNNWDWFSQFEGAGRSKGNAQEPLPGRTAGFARKRLVLRRASEPAEM